MRNAARDGRPAWWRSVLSAGALFVDWASWPLRRAWSSPDALDRYALVHMGSAAGDTLVAIALADTVFFSIPVEEAQLKVALYLALTMAPLAIAGPMLVPLLDRAGPRRAISVAAAAGRAAVALYAASQIDGLLLFPTAFLLLVLSRVHLVTKNGLTMAYAGTEEGLVRANARLARMAIAGALLAAVPGLAAVKLGGGEAVMYLAAGTFAVDVALNLRLPHPPTRRVLGEVGPRGRLAALAAPAIGAAGLRAASGFLLFLFAFALRREGQPASWYVVLAGSALVGGFLADVLAPRLPRGLREEGVVVGSLVAAGAAAFVGYQVFSLPVLAAFGLVAGAATEFGRLAFQSLMQRAAPGGAHGRVFVRYEVVFQLAWVAGAFVPALLPLGFRDGVLLLTGLYVAIVLSYLAQPYVGRRRLEARLEAESAEAPPDRGDRRSPRSHRPSDRS